MKQVGPEVLKLGKSLKVDIKFQNFEFFFRIWVQNWKYQPSKPLHSPKNEANRTKSVEVMENSKVDIKNQNYEKFSNLSSKMDGESNL